MCIENSISKGRHIITQEEIYSTANSSDKHMAISYKDAVDAINKMAAELLVEFLNAEETVLIEEAPRHVVKHDYRAPFATPQFDSSAMDGYAVSSAYLRTASETYPVTMRIMGTIAAGDGEMEFRNEVEDGYVPCVEIMTGARFPIATSGPAFDACVRVESASILGDRLENGYRLLGVTEPARENQHRRFAASDFDMDQLIIASGQKISERHVMALASVGIERVAVRKKLRVGLWSTGAELQPRPVQISTRIHDVNKSYLTSVLKNRGVVVDFLGTLNDNLVEIVKSIQTMIRSQKFDILMTTGGVSAGKFDFVRRALERLSANILFHGLAVRPGHPALSATLSPRASEGIDYHQFNKVESQASRPIAFFGLPGNPVAAAVCFEFLVMPYMSHFGVRRPQETRWARLCYYEITLGSKSWKSSINDEFRHGVLKESETGPECRISEDQSPSKTRPLLESNCFVHIPPNTAAGEYVLCYPFDDSVDSVEQPE